MDDTARKASGGVRNLRAMFENCDNSEESTPSPQPNRGRSGAPDSARATQFPVTSKLNKVQTNFIAVDKPSKPGTLWRMNKNNTTSNNNDKSISNTPPNSTDTTTSTTTSTTTPLKNNDTTTASKNSNIAKPTEDSSIDKKENTPTQDTNISPPAESTMPRRRDSFSLHDDLPADHKTIQARKASIAEEFRNRAQSIQIGASDEPIPEFAVETPALETPAVDSNRARHQLGYSEPPVPRTTANPDKATNDNQPGVHMNPADPKDESAVTEGKSLQGGSIRGLTGGDAKSMREAAVQGLKATPVKATLAMRGVPSSATNSPAAAPPNTKQPLRSPPLQKTPVSAAASQRQASAGSRNVSNASAASNASTAKPAFTTNGPPKPTTSSTARSSATGPTSSQAAKNVPLGASAISASGTGFHKPKPKSPTRPARLPASLMAPTASSISKVAGAENNNTTAQRRRESHGSLTQNKFAAQSKLKSETLKHTTSHSRPSVGPPPSSAAPKKPTTSTTKPAGDSFLERMMRPTAASANKAVGHHDEKSNPPPPKPKAAHPATTPHTSRPVTREKVHAEKENPQVGPSKVEKEQKKGEIREPSFERPRLTEKISEPVSPKTEAPPKIESKEDAIKTEVPKTFQEPHIAPATGGHEPQPQVKHEPHLDPLKAFTPSGMPLPSHSIPKVHKTERTVSMTDMENSDGTIKKLKPGEIPIPKIAKKKKPQPVAVEDNKKVQSPPRSPKPDITEIPKEKKRDFLLEVREEEKRHRRMSERPSMVKNPTSIPEVAEPEDEEIDDHQLPSSGSGDDADRSGSSMDLPRTVPKKTLSPKKSLLLAKPLSPSKEKTPTQTPQQSHRGLLEENAIESQMMDEEDVDQTDIVESQAPPPKDKVPRRLSTTAEKAMDYAAEAVDQAAAAVDEALKHKVSTAEKAKEAEAVQGLSKGHPLTSAMLKGSALDTDDEYTPTPSEKTNPFDNATLGIDGGKEGVKEREGGEHAEKTPRRQSNAGDFAIAPTMKTGEEVIAKDRQDVGGESKLPIDDETAEEGDGDDKVGDKDVTALAS